MNLQTSPAKPAGSRERSLDEVKAEFMRRAGRLNPFEDIRREDAERVMNALQSLDKDRWAQEWSKIGLGYEEKADALAKAGAAGPKLAELYMHAFDACRVGRYPTPNSPGKLQAYRHSLRMFRKAAQYFDPPLEIIELPFDGDNKLIGYLQLPPGVNKPPVVLHWGGVDGWKEDRLRIAKAIMEQGLASLTIDMPGSGENRCSMAIRQPSARSSPGSMICRGAARSTVGASASGAAALAPTGRRGSPTPPPTASRARCSTAATFITVFRRSG